jgi:hypothetical protein
MTQRTRVRITRGVTRRKSGARAHRGGSRLANRLALIRAFCTSPEPSTRPKSLPVHNFFRSAEATASRVAEQRKFYFARAASRVIAAQQEKLNSTKTLMPSDFLYTSRIFATTRAPRKVLRARFQMRLPPLLCRGEKGGGCTQKAVESLLIFSCCSNPVVVQIDSRLHWTYIAIHSWLGGQQWRRRERRQRRRRRQNVGRRSSLRRNRSSASHVSEIASHGPAAVEDGSTIFRDGPAQVDKRGASAGRRCELRGRANGYGHPARWRRRETGKPNLTLARASGFVPQPSRRRPRCL